MSEEIKSVLIVDDDSQLRLLLATAFQREGWHVVEAPDAHYALTLTVRGDCDFDVILVDVNMPGMNGVEFVRILKTLKEQQNTIIAVITGSASNEQEKLARDLKPTFMYRKPFNVLDLMDEICRHMK